MVLKLFNSIILVALVFSLTLWIMISNHVWPLLVIGIKDFGSVEHMQVPRTPLSLPIATETDTGLFGNVVTSIILSFMGLN